MLKLVVCIIVLAAVCCAQEHLTCLRTDDVLNQQQHPQTHQRALQGPPGKRGAKGQIGSRGMPGQKGEPGIPDDQQIALLQEQYNSLFIQMETLKNQTREYQQNQQINSLSQQVEALRNQSRDNRQLVTDVFSKGLYVPPHVYIYQLIPGQSWQKSQEVCQNWGGHLAMHGVRTLENRKKLIQNLSINNFKFWIGANDIASEGNWVWLNGERASSSELIWASGQPNNIGGQQDCGIVIGYSGSSNVGRAADESCTSLYQGLCEKQI